jgi:hypothetical protein
MKKTVTTIFSLLFGSLFLYSCETCENPTITYPTESDNEWLVYKPGNKPVYKDERDTLIRSYKFIGFLGQNVPGAGASVSDDCLEKLDTQVTAQLSDTTGKHSTFYTYILKRPDSLQVKIAVDNVNAWTLDQNKPTYQTLEVGGNVYADVFEVKADSLKINSVKKVLFNKQYGFLQVEFYNKKRLTLVR